MAQIHLILLVITACLASNAYAEGPMQEGFANLSAWEPVLFPKIKAHTRYELASEGGNTYLRAVSNAAASAMAYKEPFDIHTRQRLGWSWRVKAALPHADPSRKEEDDYAARLYVSFEYEPGRAGLGQRILYGALKAFYGEYPPESTLIYVWASLPQRSEVMNSPYTDRAKVIALRAGDAEAGNWVREEVDMLSDYRRAFGKEPSPRARLALMTDTDNTGGYAEAGYDDIVLRGAADGGR